VSVVFRGTVPELLGIGKGLGGLETGHWNKNWPVVTSKRLAKADETEPRPGAVQFRTMSVAALTPNCTVALANPVPPKPPAELAREPLAGSTNGGERETELKPVPEELVSTTDTVMIVDASARSTITDNNVKTPSTSVKTLFFIEDPLLVRIA